MSTRYDYLKISEIDKIVKNVEKSFVQKHGNRIFHDPKVLQLLLKVIYHGMLNVKEAVNIQKDDVDPNNHQIILRETKTGWTKCHCHGQDKNCKNCNGKGRYQKPEKTIFSSKNLWEEIRDYLRTSDSKKFVFENSKTHKGISRQSIWVLVTGIAEQSGFGKKIDPKILRNSRAQHLRISRILTESEIHQLCRGSKIQISGSYVPKSDRELLDKEEKANTFLLTYCENCDYKNPDDARYCCMCATKLRENKSLIL